MSSEEADLSAFLGSRERARAVLRAGDDAEAERWAAGIERTGLRVVTAFDPEYPEPLREIADPPFLLFALGRLERLRLPVVAIVGRAVPGAEAPGFAEVVSLAERYGLERAMAEPAKLIAEETTSLLADG